jgi:Holliday junction resolvasome RuvABC endonuclease subunit
MVILGIDHGNRTGYAIMKDKKVKDTGSFTLESEDRNNKLLEYYQNILNLIKEHKPDMIAIEYPSDMANAETARLLVGYYTINKLIAMIMGIKIRECYISSVRKVVTGTGRAEKVTVCDSLCTKLGIARKKLETPIYIKQGKRKGQVKCYLYDESDALALCYYTLFEKGTQTPHGVMPFEYEEGEED